MEYGFTATTIPAVSHSWSQADWTGAIRVRLSIRRNNYSVQSGLYRMGKPDNKSDVFISASYKLSFDILRRSLEGIDCWILVLDTRGINVWCAAGKGTFGSDELIRQIRESFLDRVVQHRRIIVPQLGAPGVSLPRVLRETGFRVRFGPVMAKDIRQYIKNGYRKDSEMHRARFNMADRLVLTPVEIVGSFKWLIILLLIFLFLTGISGGGYSFSQIVHDWKPVTLIIGAGWFAGAFITPVLLPWIPSRPFASKGIIAGLAVITLTWLLVVGDIPILYLSGLAATGIAIASYLAMNFTGSSTYASPSGVKKEMKQYIPVQIALAGAGIIIFTISNIIG